MSSSISQLYSYPSRSRRTVQLFVNRQNTIEMVEKEECKEYSEIFWRLHTIGIKRSSNLRRGEEILLVQTKKLTRILDVGSRKKTWYRLIKTGLSRGKKKNTSMGFLTTKLNIVRSCLAGSLKNKKIMQEKYVWIYKTSFCFVLIL